MLSITGMMSIRVQRRLALVSVVAGLLTYEAKPDNFGCSLVCLNPYPEAIISNVETGETRCGMASTQLIDDIWRRLEQSIPTQLTAPRTLAQLEIWEEHIRFAQWRHITSGSDRWKEFCSAAQHFEKSFRPQKVQHLNHCLKAFQFTVEIVLQGFRIALSRLQILEIHSLRRSNVHQSR